ncbi:MAG: hypothetical protein CSA95_06945 [Bacteroidetes bacterium]|nr:MAG: hypothetical protein CSA95_06945 [Bacteroidota bacterium]PIE88421.1 MAG: hypothetical protein CSA04_02025 [Bacteroidota bacterium]
MVNRTHAPSNGILNLNHITLPTPEVFHLDAGLPVFCIEGGSQELCKVEFIVGAGSDKQEKPLVAAYTNHMLKEGTATRSSLQISEELDFYGAFLEHYTTPDTSVIALYTLNKHLEATLPIFVDLIFHAIFPEKEFETLNRRKEQAYRINEQKVQYVAGKKFRPLLFGEAHPYGGEIVETSFEEISLSDLRSFYEKYYTPDNARIIIAGKIDRKLIPLLNKLLERGEKRSTTSPPPNFHREAPRPQTLVIPREQTVQSALRMGSLTLNRDHEDYPGVEFTSIVLGGYFGSRLMRNIREDKGYTYGIGMRVVPLKHGAYFTIATEVDTHVTQATIDEVRKEMKKLRTEEMEQEELALVKSYLRGSLMRNFDGAMALSERFREMSDAGLDNRFYQRVFATVEQITTQEILRIAGSYFHEENLSMVIAGKR